MQDQHLDAACAGDPSPPPAHAQVTCAYQLGWRICSAKRGSWSFLDFAWVSGAGNLDVKFNERLSSSPGMENVLVGKEETDHSK